MSETIPKKSLIRLRDAKVADQAFISSTFLKGNYYGNPYYRQIDKDTFMLHYQEVLKSLLIRCTTKIACLQSDEDVIIGYSVYEPGVLHWVFVKDVWRKIGVAKDMIPVDINIYTHTTKIGQAIAPKTWKLNPWRI